ncbi:GDP-mannose 4,6-dehydratase [Tahibacter amnicola]|uniref:GDP-mannose 4,6-dehydratase n=1 Tax=Tahibacter amnicola TaxID=2976241 RepID=A0ABY6BFT7_9GAMM|nr:GDP-mannose 4,6-dehydratase [Tahibacter amnicola]UXI67955.1 GDP-mannose 4,6-dehydratase [Tahibacter amnicola]
MTAAGVALVTGAAGQDGAWLCRQLLDAGWQVWAAVHTSVPPVPWRWRELSIAGHPQLQVAPLCIEDAEACHDVVARSGASRIFHLAAISSVAQATADPVRAVQVNGMGTVHLLDAVRRVGGDAAVVVASSAEVHPGALTDERTPAVAAHPYALSKLIAEEAVRCYRNRFGLRASIAILFNHESELRGDSFVTRKIAAAAARAGAGSGETLSLGNLDATRDFGYAPDYMAALRALADLPAPEDLVIATGEVTAIRQFTTMAYAAAGIELRWEGQGAGERAIDTAGAVRIRVDPSFLRASDAPLQRGDATRARQRLGLRHSRDVFGIAQVMVAAEQRRLGLASLAVDTGTC